MALIIAPDSHGQNDILRGTKFSDVIEGNGYGDYYGMKGNDNISSGITSREGYVEIFGGFGRTVLGANGTFAARPDLYGSGNDTLQMGTGVLAYGGDGKDRYVFHGPGELGKQEGRVFGFNWMLDRLDIDNSDTSRGEENGLTVSGLHQARIFESTSAEGRFYVQLNGFEFTSYSRNPNVDTQAGDVLTYSRGDDGKWNNLYIPTRDYDGNGTVSRAEWEPDAKEFIYDHARPDAHDQWGGDQFIF